MSLRIALVLALLPIPLSAQTRIHAFHGATAGDRFGIAVACAGDVDADGRDDLVVGAFYADPNGQNSGLCRVYSGADGSVLLTVDGDQPWDELGWAVDGVGDVDADGHADIVIGVPFHDDVNGIDCGQVRVVSGLTGQTLWLVIGDGTRDQFGSAVDGIGDVDDDGVPDLIAGRRYADGTGTDAGQAKVLSGRDGSAIYTFAGAATGDYLGWEVAGVGDVDGDGTPDFAIGVPHDDGGAGAESGSVEVRSGATGVLIRTLRGALPGDQFGIAVEAAGDVDRDGRADVIVGAWSADPNGYRSGQAQVFSGRDGSVLFTFDGDARNDFFGWAVTGVGDVDGDGTPDLAAGGWAADPNGSESGMARVFSGVDGSTLATFRGGAAGDRLGWSIAAAGDVDADGYADLIVCAYLANVNGPSSGSAYVESFAGTGSPPRVRVLGAPCPASDGRLPRVGVEGRPALGDAFDVRLLSAPRSAACALNFGPPLALALDPVGAPGCTVYADPRGGYTIGLTTDASGRVTVPLAVPNASSLVGVRLDLQWMVRDPGANVLGVVTSDAAAVTLGR